MKMFNADIIYDNEKASLQLETLSDGDRSYFDRLINTIVIQRVGNSTRIQYDGKIKKMMTLDAFTSIYNDPTWNMPKKRKFEAYIIERYNNTDNFSAWCEKRRFDLTSNKVTNQPSVHDDKEFNLIFIRNGIFLDCYGIDNVKQSKQVKFIASSNNKVLFENSIVSYLRYFSNLKSIVNLPDNKIMRNIKIELNKGNLISNNKVEQIANDKETYCLAYFKLPSHQSPDNAYYAPSWDKFLSLFKTELERKIFRAWIYSIFVAKDKGRQMLWVEGEGHTGKSTIASVIGEILAEYNQLLFNSIEVQPFEKINLVNFDRCRFAVLSNQLDPNLMTRKEIMVLTGNDYTQIKKLYHDPENKKLLVKIMINSNIAPNYSDKIAHEATRMIHLKMDESLIEQSRKTWDMDTQTHNRLLKKEFPEFMKQASIDYQQLMQSNGLIKTKI